MIRHPHLIQRCELGNGTLEYDYMGMSEFEIGGQREALRAIFAGAMTTGSVKITVQGRDVDIFAVSFRGFDLVSYGPHLQQMAEGKLRLAELAYFDRAVEAKLGIEAMPDFMAKINVWFDFPNGVLWTLTEENQHELVRVLEGIRAKWAARVAQ